LWLKSFIDFKIINALPEYLKLEVVRGIYDSEGSVNYYKRIKKRKRNGIFSDGVDGIYKSNELLIRISNGNDNLMRFVGTVLKQNNIGFFIHRKKSNGFQNLNMWCGNAVHFWRLFGGFTIQRKEKIVKEYEDWINKRETPSEKVRGERNPMFGKRYTDEQKKVLGKISKENWKNIKLNEAYKNAAIIFSDVSEGDKDG
jgi:curved DNA-binding protein CbpA